MQVAIESADPAVNRRRPELAQTAGWAALVLLALGLWATLAKPLGEAWRSDSSLSHGPLIPVIAAFMLWARRDRLREWRSADPGGLALLVGAALLHVAAVWADVAFLIPLSWIGLVAGITWFLAGRQAIAASAGALCFLVFMIPWPTVLIERLTFPMQLMSSAYAALLSGLGGLTVHRSGVELTVATSPDAKPVYGIFVAQKCSGLASLAALLALGYLIAYMTPVKWGWRALLVAAVVPLTLVMNAVRLTFVLYAGAYHGAALATWIHDHEEPVLVLLCSAALMALRRGLIVWTRPKPPRIRESGGDAGAVPVIGG